MYTPLTVGPGLSAINYRIQVVLSVHVCLEGHIKQPRANVLLLARAGRQTRESASSSSERLKENPQRLFSESLVTAARTSSCDAGEVSVYIPIHDI